MVKEANIDSMTIEELRAVIRRQKKKASESARKYMKTSVYFKKRNRIKSNIFYWKSIKNGLANLNRPLSVKEENRLIKSIERIKKGNEDILEVEKDRQNIRKKNCV